MAQVANWLEGFMMVSLEETSQSVRPEKAASRMSRRTLFRAPWLVLPGVARAKDALSAIPTPVPAKHTRCTQKPPQTSTSPACCSSHA